MNNKEINILNNFMHGEKVVYFLLCKEINRRSVTQNARLALDLILSKSYEHIGVNINITKQNTVSIQSLKRSGKSNAIAFRHETAVAISNDIGLSIDTLTLAGDMYVKLISKCNGGKKHKKRAFTTKPVKNDNDIDHWIDRTRRALIKNSTPSEKKLYKKLCNSFEGDIDRQCPFVIDGKIYFADIVLSGKKIAIEVDGGYHSTPEQTKKDGVRDADFGSMGYSVIRCTNDQVQDDIYVSNLIDRLSKIKI